MLRLDIVRRDQERLRRVEASRRVVLRFDIVDRRKQIDGHAR
jgi:hypothetical protein